MASTNFGYDYSKVIVTDLSYNIVESFSLPVCNLDGTPLSMADDSTTHRLRSGETVQVNRGLKARWTCHFNNAITKTNLTPIYRMLNYRTDEYLKENTEKKIFWLIPHADKPYKMFRVNIVNDTFDLKLLEQDSYEDSYENFMIVFEAAELVTPYDMSIDFPMNPIVWYDAGYEWTVKDSLVGSLFSSHYISKLIDRSGNFYNATATTPLTLPSRGLGGFFIDTWTPYISMTSVATHYFQSLFTMATPVTGFIVMATIAWTNNGTILDGGINNTSKLFYRTATPNIAYTNNNTNICGDNTGLTLTTPKIVTFASDDDTNRAWLDVNAGTPIRLTAGSNLSIGGLTIGSQANASNYSSFDFSEIIIFNSDMSSAQKAEVRDYLSRKYFNTTY